MSILVLYGGNRPKSNTEFLTKKVIENMDVEEIYLKDYLIEPIMDHRHAAGGFPAVADDYSEILERMLTHDTIIFSTPIYWYSMTGIMKNFIDRWSQTLKDSHYPHFKNQMADKSTYVITVGGDQPHIKGLPMIEQFQHIFDFMGSHFAGYIIGEANLPLGIKEDANALFQAKQLNHKLLKLSFDKT
ncbi:flavodoxin family protein [Kurthia sibirica]|uniref:NAD(P)H-dependent oxidoreductase n=1 Tax=Kurthia sibirica TaxID=202750 RepID=A0A2U3AJ48_9BACL|nr:flavodoxin family protein [Kurthia sibirica]PWI24563.1 NAD(P)H-dependent oxidoreductase [Kurthia sibirica]GEK33514.1 NAD(P)H-dependent oxidoreductase [Kurthia sibirica]